MLQAAAAQRDRLTTAQWVERTWRSLGGDAYLTSAELANAQRYLKLLDEIEQQAGTIDPALLKARLARLYAESAASADAVDLMTIHGAKGLEWDVVIVPGLEKRARVSNSRLLTWNEIDTGDAAAAHIVLAPIVGKGEESRELNDWLNSIERSRNAAERKRLFYVACTRAREELHLFAAPEARPEGPISPAYGSLLSAAWPVAEQHFIQARERDVNIQTGPVPSLTNSPPSLDEFVGDLAATAQERPAMLERLPLSFSPGSRFAEAQQLSYGDAATNSGSSHFERPEGSFEARAFGNAVHGFLEIVTRQLAQTASVEQMLKQVAEWEPRIASVLRSDGLPAARVVRLAARVRTALENTLRDPEGLWVLGPHAEASSELALTVVDRDAQERTARPRLSRRSNPPCFRRRLPMDCGLQDHRAWACRRRGISRRRTREVRSSDGDLRAHDEGGSGQGSPRALLSDDLADGLVDARNRATAKLRDAE